MAWHVARTLAEESAADAGVTVYVGVAAIITAATGLVGAVAALVRVLRAPVRHSQHHDDEDEGGD